MGDGSGMVDAGGWKGANSVGGDMVRRGSVWHGAQVGAVAVMGFQRKRDWVFCLGRSLGGWTTLTLCAAVAIERCMVCSTWSGSPRTLVCRLSRAALTCMTLRLRWKKWHHGGCLPLALSSSVSCSTGNTDLRG